MPIDDALRREFEYYRTHQDEIVKQYDGLYVVVRGEQVIGHYADQLTAIAETTKQYPLGTFLVQKAERGHTPQTFHTRIAFRR